ncbi:MAG: hypothetical protein AB7K73_07230 [Gammaproteobacteria bacterium]
MEVLDIDHINGGGTREKREIGHRGIYRRIIAGHTEDYQVLCVRCHRKKTLRNKDYLPREAVAA